LVKGKAFIPGRRAALRVAADHDLSSDRVQLRAAALKKPDKSAAGKNSGARPP